MKIAKYYNSFYDGFNSTFIILDVFVRIIITCLVLVFLAEHEQESGLVAIVFLIWAIKPFLDLMRDLNRREELKEELKKVISK